MNGIATVAAERAVAAVISGGTVLASGPTGSEESFNRKPGQ